MEVIQDGTVAYMSLMENEMRRFQFQQGDSEGFVNYAPHDQEGQDVGHVSGAPQVHPRLAAFAGRRRCQPLRPEILRRRRHRNAAGGKSFVSMQETIDHYIRSVKEFAAEGHLG